MHTQGALVTVAIHASMAVLGLVGVAVAANEVRQLFTETAVSAGEVTT